LPDIGKGGFSCLDKDMPIPGTAKQGKCFFYENWQLCQKTAKKKAEINVKAGIIWINGI